MARRVRTCKVAHGAGQTLVSAGLRSLLTRPMHRESQALARSRRDSIGTAGAAGAAGTAGAAGPASHGLTRALRCTISLVLLPRRRRSVAGTAVVARTHRGCSWKPVSLPPSPSSSRSVMPATPRPSFSMPVTLPAATMFFSSCRGSSEAARAAARRRMKAGHGRRTQHRAQKHSNMQLAGREHRRSTTPTPQPGGQSGNRW
jgi:hypothetical protein